VSRLAVGAADGTGVDVEDWARDCALGVLELVGRVDRLGLAVVAAEHAHFARRRRRTAFLLKSTRLGALQTLALSQDLDQLGLGQDVFDGVGCHMAGQRFTAYGRARRGGRHWYTVRRGR